MARVEGLGRTQHAPDQVQELAHEGTEDDLVWLATIGQALCEGGFTPDFTDTYKKADLGRRSVHVEAKKVQCRVQARCG